MLRLTTKHIFESTKQGLLRKIVDDHIKKMEAIEAHTFENCVNGDHVIEGYATGGRDGHYVQHCKLCDHKEEGWD